MNILQPWAFLLLIPVGIWFVFLGRQARRQAQRQGPWTDESPLPRWLWLLTGVLVVLALARPVWDPQGAYAPGSGQSAVFLVDVSRSMTASDPAPSRLETAKAALQRLTPNLQGDLVGLMAFAGTSVILSPLTSDRGFLDSSVQNLGVTTVSRGGTKVTEVLDLGLKAFGHKEKKITFWMLTDGGDQSAGALNSARTLAQQGHRLFIWGLGGDLEVPVPERPVMTKIERDAMKALAQAGGGAYYEASRDSLTTAYMATRQVGFQEKLAVRIWQEGGLWILGALAALWGAVLLWRSLGLRRWK